MPAHLPDRLPGVFDWQVAVDPYLRVDLEDGDVLSPLAFSADWPTVSGLVSSNGSIESTGWQVGTFTINTQTHG